MSVPVNVFLPQFGRSRILITGGTGSFGHAFVRRVLSDNPDRLVIFSRDEQKQEQMAREFSHPSLRFFVGCVRDLERLELATRGIEYVVHAAALKIIPSCEYNPFEAVHTNIIGAENIVRASIKNGIRKVVALSTDKAVSPINLYGATKLAAEKVFIAANGLGGADGPSFSVVRYGNVANSRGSVIPLYRSLIEKGEKLPLTDPAMTRFWITLEEAVDLVNTAFYSSYPGDVLIPRMPSFKIHDLIQAFCALYPDRIAGCRIIGVRPGEKMHEDMITVHEATKTVQKDDTYIIRNLWTSNDGATSVPNDFCYSSGTNSHWLTVSALEGLLK